jgi:hypothetical protein
MPTWRYAQVTILPYLIVDTNIWAISSCCTLRPGHYVCALSASPHGQSGLGCNAMHIMSLIWFGGIAVRRNNIDCI